MMELPEIASREEWLAARKRVLVQEKEFTRARDALAAERRRLPMVRVDKPYLFGSVAGPVSLLDMFEGRRQLIMHHFVWTYDEHGEPREEPKERHTGLGAPAGSAGLRLHDQYTVEQLAGREV
jgi:predicted dithiol-disulfide oxidoreductase (DUF899 family)